VHTSEWVWIESCCASAPNLASCASSQAVQCVPQQAHCSYQSWEAQWWVASCHLLLGRSPAASSLKFLSRALAWHACMDRTKPSLYVWSPHRQQPLDRAAHVYILPLVFMHMNIPIHVQAFSLWESFFFGAGPASPANCAADLVVASPDGWSSCCCPCGSFAWWLKLVLLPLVFLVLLLIGNQTSLHSQVMSLAHRAFQMRLPSVRGLDGLSSCWLSLHCSLQRMGSASNSVTSTTLMHCHHQEFPLVFQFYTVLKTTSASMYPAQKTLVSRGICPPHLPWLHPPQCHRNKLMGILMQ